MRNASPVVYRTQAPTGMEWVTYCDGVEPGRDETRRPSEDREGGKEARVRSADGGPRRTAASVHPKKAVALVISLARLLAAAKESKAGFRRTCG